MRDKHMKWRITDTAHFGRIVRRSTHPHEVRRPAHASANDEELARVQADTLPQLKFHVSHALDERIDDALNRFANLHGASYGPIMHRGTNVHRHHAIAIVGSNHARFGSD